MSSGADTSEPDRDMRGPLGAALANEPKAPQPSLYDLWRQAGGGTENYDRQKYHDLMFEHAALLRPGDAGYEDASPNLPCGWPHRSEEKPVTATPETGPGPIAPDLLEAVSEAVFDWAGENGEGGGRPFWDDATKLVLEVLAEKARIVSLAGPENTARQLVAEALHLRQNGEYAPGGRENWRDWDRKAEDLLRGES